MAVDDVQGAVATLDKKASAALHAKAGVAKKQPKEKLSRAEKKARSSASVSEFPDFSDSRRWRRRDADAAA